MAAAGVLLLWVAGFGAAPACRQASDSASDYTVSIEFTTDTVRVGQEVQATIRLSHGPDRAPWPGAALQLEGHMSHPGMVPVVISARESSPGTYLVPVTFTMAGSWDLVVAGTLPDGRRVRAPVADRLVLPPT
jgi:hypothetical protein